MAKLKLKKKVLNGGIILIIVLVVGSTLIKHYYNEYQYKNTYEYKLVEHGYSIDEAKSLISYFNDDERLEELLIKNKNSLILELIKEKYYIHKYLDRYLDYASKNQDTSINDIIALINVNRDYDYYENDIPTDTSKGILLNVNKYYTLDSEYVPDNLVDISLRYSYSGNQVTKETYDAYVSLWNAAQKEGYTLIVNSSYRNYESQESVYNDKKYSSGTKEADKVAARPGHSEHQTGLAIDVFEINNQSTATFKDSEAYIWLKENAYKFGFIERYPENKEDITGYSFESWHWRYIGEEAAKIIHDEDITFDEYYAYYIENND